MSRPNFFVVGAPKCGTTALAEYLGSHPRAFLSTPKEPFYFCADLPGLGHAASEGEYLRLFDRAPSEAKAVGEATTLYLYSRVALPAIRRFAPDGKILVLLRNPVEIAHAFHSEQLSNLFESEASFERAWSLQEERLAGRSVPGFCREPMLLQYRAIASVGSQLERLYGIFPPEQVKVLWFDDLRRDAAALYRETLAFLALPDDRRREFPVVNENRTLRLGAYSRFVTRPPAGVSRWVWRAKTTIGLERVSLLGALRRWNARPTPRAPLAPEFRRLLAEEFRNEVDRLERVTGRDLSSWR